MAALSVDDLRPRRLVVVDPAPIPEEGARRTYEWMSSWGLLGNVRWEALCDVETQNLAHQL